jgi:hypothetical protein
MGKLRVTKHAEGAVKDFKVTVHGVAVEFTDNEGEAQSFGETNFARFTFTSDDRADFARLRIEIRSESAIVYREEAHILENSSHDSGDRYFKV